MENMQQIVAEVVKGNFKKENLLPCPHAQEFPARQQASRTHSRFVYSIDYIGSIVTGEYL
jgi:hypothetical protein